jgi:GR25 family glycosyltransferase involved in LPS biosynthesis
MFSRIINLKDRIDRWNLVQPFLKSKHNIQRFDALKFKKEDAMNLLTARARADFMKPMRYQHETIFGVGAIGCAMSHLTVWREFLASNASHALILEDDIDPKYAGDLDSKIAEMRDCDIFMLGWMGKPTVKPDGSVLAYPSGKMLWGTHAYILNRRAAETLCIHGFPLEMQADYMLQAIADQYNLKIRCASSPIKQKYTGSWSNIMGSNIFSVCLFCDPNNVYIAFGVLLFIALLQFKRIFY